jgi:Tub family
MKVSRAINLVDSAPVQQRLGGDGDQQGLASWIHETPCKIQCDPTTGRVHCTLRRSTVAGSGLVILQVDSCNQQRLYAKRGAWNSRIKFTIHDTAMTPVGWLQQVKSNFSCHVYELAMVGARKAADSGQAGNRRSRFNREKTVAAVISYHVPSLKDFLTKSPPRRVQFVLVPNYGTSSSESAAALPRDEQAGVVEHTSLAVQPTEVSEASTTLLESKEPYLKTNGRRGLDFAGRGSGSSCKNMQLVQVEKRVGETKVSLQMAKWLAKVGDGGTKPSVAKEKVYHVDFAVPITPFQAFGFALAQLDL